MQVILISLNSQSNVKMMFFILSGVLEAHLNMCNMEDMKKYIHNIYTHAYKRL